jgi:CRP-like cAMP-binding protein
MTRAEASLQFSGYLSKHISLTKEQLKEICKLYELKQYSKKEMFFNQGDIASKEGFVLSGSWRIFHRDVKGAEHVLYFAFSNWWIGDMASFANQSAAFFSAAAIENSWVLEVDKVKKDKLLNAFPEMERLFRIIIEKHLVVLQKRFLLTISTQASERYLELIQRAPGIEQLVPQHQIASYLGILPESLSRMKKNMMKDPKSKTI